MDMHGNISSIFINVVNVGINIILLEQVHLNSEINLWINILTNLKNTKSSRKKILKIKN